MILFISFSNMKGYIMNLREICITIRIQKKIEAFKEENKNPQIV